MSDTKQSYLMKFRKCSSFETLEKYLKGYVKKTRVSPLLKFLVLMIIVKPN
uniref:Cys-tRNA(Pro) deacylase YbaK n=1 Tax=Escherichia coli TaxID=562 RepID=A0A6G9I2L9_ECOLX|nr:Cys-tRNA(Pro) deacylase YbaK [Escherichia coli]